MKCPRDGSTLFRENYKGAVVVDRCPTCSGVWLDAGELQAIEKTVENDRTETLRQIDVIARAYELAKQATLPEIQCPKCGGQLEAGEYAYCSQIMIDRCVECSGIWLDAGELAALEQFFEQAAAEEREEYRSHEQAKVRQGFFASLFN